MYGFDFNFDDESNGQKKQGGKRKHGLSPRVVRMISRVRASDEGVMSFVCEDCGERFRLSYLVVPTSSPLVPERNLCRDCSKKKGSGIDIDTSIRLDNLKRKHSKGERRGKEMGNVLVVREEEKETVRELPDPETLQVTYGEFMTIKQIAEATGISEMYVRRRIQKGKWSKGTDDRGRVVVPTQEVATYMRTRHGKAAADTRGNVPSGKTAAAATAEEAHIRAKEEIKL